jgi:hypothetical protein
VRISATEWLMTGLCPACIHMKETGNDRGSLFLLCQLSRSDPRYPKYPRLPVLSCEGYREKPGPEKPAASETRSTG